MGGQNGFDGESDADLWCFVFVGFFYKKGTKLERLQLKCKKLGGIFLRIEKEREPERQRVKGRTEMLLVTLKGSGWGGLFLNRRS